MGPRAAAAAVALLLGGCTADQVSLRWRVELDASAAGRAARVEAWIVRGACGEAGPVLERVELGAAAAAGEVVLEPGTYAFHARAADGACQWFAAGCEDAQLPLGDGSEVVVPVTVTGAEEDACAGRSCLDGRCSGGDGGTDGGVDGGVDGGRDGGADAGPDGGVDGGAARCGEALAEPDVLPVCQPTGSVSVDADLGEYADAVPLEVTAGAATATFRMLWDCDYLYVGVEIADAEVFASFTTHDSGQLFTTDAAEVFVDVAHDAASADVGTDDHHLIVGATGATLDARGDGSFFDVTYEMPGAEVATAVLGTLDDEVPDTGWIAELGLPWAELGLTACPTRGTVMGGDLALDDETRPAGVREHAYGDWAGLITFANPAAWNDFLLLDATGSR